MVRKANLNLAGFLLIVALFFTSANSCSFTITNSCPYTIWPGTLAGAGTPQQLTTTGFQLNSGESVRIGSVPGWSGRIWARTGCTFDKMGAGVCQTGDCGGRLECNGMGASPPASLFEITLGQGNDKDYYDVSIVDGYNIPLVAAPVGVGGCNATGCVYDLNIGMLESACEAFGLDQYCCSGEFANPTTCKPSFYSAIFKRACPRAYSYAFDDRSSTFTCKASDYSITFCPQSSGLRRSNGVPTVLEHRNGEVVQASSSTTTAFPAYILLLSMFKLFLAN
ncbi:hypothetical protein Syun_024791 [Stephania yunnanensis]|uniref:Thaumatin-like protein n=1 Tax=Stephania yunnanensis TaxID=152371 RepID=A0AAP0EQF1_9MAGN